MIGILAHLFYPRYSNNHRPKILHISSLFLVVSFLFFSTLFLSSFKANNPKVLGAYSEISIRELLILTNQARTEQNIPPLTLNQQLSAAADMKVRDMLSNNYWAHNSPSGKTPWDFIKESGYDYVYAGENLARGFSLSNDVINAWLASPEHRSNMMSRNFSEVGFAVESGNLTGEDTTIVAEELGGKNIITPGGKPTILSTQTEDKISPNTDNNLTNSKVNSPVVSSKFIEIILGIFIGTLILDLIVIERKKIVRIAGHNLDHILFLIIVFICIMFLGKGIIL